MTNNEGVTSPNSKSRQVRSAAQLVLEQAWREPGFCVPNNDVYPHQWLWDSCFHAIAWSSLGSKRGVQELTHLLSVQAEDGFVPHMIYWHHPELDGEFWGRSGVTPITQPPMYGHAAAALHRRGDPITDELVDRARRGIEHLAGRNRTTSGLIPVFHPWETGCDDSPRWDHCFDDGGAENDWEVDRSARRARKKEFVDALDRSPEGHGLDSSAFAVGSIGFNALVAWNAAELVQEFPDRCQTLSPLVAQLARSIADRWNGQTWVDEWRSPHQGSVESSEAPEESRVRTLDAMLALLVDPRPEGFAQLVDEKAFGSQFGPRGVAISERAYRPDRYWRGSTWPQLVYLLVQASQRAVESAPAGLSDSLSEALLAGGQISGWAEYWHPDTGEGFGAKPQTWATLGIATT